VHSLASNDCCKSASQLIVGGVIVNASGCSEFGMQECLLEDAVCGLKESVSPLSVGLLQT